MDYIIRIKKALDYVEENLTSEIELKNIANEAYFSLYHFHRVFGAIVGDNMKEFIRKRRLTEAGNDLIKSNERIIDIAIKYQFGSQAAFMYLSIENSSIFYLKFPLEEQKNYCSSSQRWVSFNL